VCVEGLRYALVKDAEDRSLAVSIHQAIASSIRLELFPKSTIDVFITIIENDGIEGCIASGSVAASTALADAGIEMLGLVTACSAAIVGDDIHLDPSEAEARASSGTVILACMPALDRITSIWQSGHMIADTALKCMEQCHERCIDIHSIVSQSLLEHRRAK